MSSEAKHIKVYTAQDIMRYWNNQMSTQEMHELEKAAIEDSLLADAMEGYSKSQKDPATDLEWLKRAVSERANDNNSNLSKKQWFNWRVAAAVILLAGMGALTYRITHINQQSAALARVDSSARQKEPLLKPTDNRSTAKVQPADSIVAPSKPQSETPSGNRHPSSIAASARPVLHKDSVVFSPNNAKEEVTKADDGRLLEKAAPAAKKAATSSVLQERAAGADVSSNQRMLNSFSGKVVDQQHSGIPNASIKVNNASLVLTTDQHGYFQFNAADSIANISVSSVGFDHKDLFLNSNQSNLDIVLSASNAGLQEVVVTGYGQKDKKNRSNLKSVLMSATPLMGWASYNRYIDSARRYPPNEPPLEGEVVVDFKVNSDGTLSSFNIEKSLEDFYDKEAIRLIKEGPAWRSATGKKLRARLTVKF